MEGEIIKNKGEKSHEKLFFQLKYLFPHGNMTISDRKRTMLPFAGHWHPVWSKKQDCRIKLI